MKRTASETGVQHIAMSGGVSANSALRTQFFALADREGWTAHVPPLAYCTDNGAMIAMAGLFLLEARRTAALDAVPHTR